VVVTGRVDDHGRALLRVPVAATAGGPRIEIEAWVDTAFNGGLTLPRGVAAGLGLAPGVSGDAVLADGQTVALDTFVCCRDWFGGTYRTLAVATDGAFPLLGTLLLSGRRLTIDYAVKTVELT
jgi:predicted aspartyl protease